MRNRIIQVRRVLGLTQKEFGLNLGCSRDKISNIELGRVVPDDVFINHICVVYKVSDHWMKTGEGEMWSKTTSDSRHISESYEQLSPSLKCVVDAILRMPEKDRPVLEAFLAELAAALHDHAGL